MFKGFESPLIYHEKDVDLATLDKGIQLPCRVSVGLLQHLFRRQCIKSSFFCHHSNINTGTRAFDMYTLSA